MDYTDYLKNLQDATLFDLYRVHCAIDRMLENSQRQTAVKNKLVVSIKASYFEPSQNKLIGAVVIEKKRTRALVRNKQDGRCWDIPFYMINLDGVDTSIHTQKPGNSIDREALSTGDSVGFYCKAYHEDCYGVVIKINPKKAKLKLSTEEIWNVPYRLLFPVIDGHSQQDGGTGLFIEGTCEEA